VASPAYTLTGNFEALIGATTGYVTLRLKDSRNTGIPPVISGTGIFAQVLYTSAIGANFSVTVYGNDVIVPTSTVYTISVYSVTNERISSADYYLSGSGTNDLSTLTPSSGIAPLPPTPPVTPVGENLVYAGPTTGSPVIPTFRSLVVADIPAGVGSTSSSILYVSPSGNDSHDGLTWQTAKLTISGALVALPSGSTGNCGRGIIYFSDSVSATPLLHQGLGLMGLNDPNYSSPPVSSDMLWLRVQYPISIIGVPIVNYGPNPHLGRAAIVSGDGASNARAGIWISSTAVPLYFENIDISYPARAWVIGVDSNNAITASASGCTGITFRNCTGSTSGNTGLGPTWTIGGESYWIELVDCGSEGSIGQNGHVYSDDTAQAFLIDGRGSNGGQIINFRGYTNLGSGGIKFYAGLNDSSQVSIEDVTEEGTFGASSPVAPVYWVASGGNGNMVRIGSALIADGGSTQMPAVQNDGNAQIFVCNAWGVGINTQGSVVSVSGYGPNNQNVVISPTRQGQAGFFSGWATQFKRVVGLKDDSRRQFVGYKRFVNSVSQIAANWTAQNGAISTGITGPDGLANAGRVTSTISGGGAVFLRGNKTYAVGDWLIVGAWVRSNSGNGPVQSPIFFQMLTTGFTFTGGGSTNDAGSFIRGDGEWQWLVSVQKIATIGTNPCDTEFSGFTDTTHTLDYCYPIFIQIASGTISDNEVFELVQALIPNRDDAPVGSVSTQRGAMVMTDGIQMPKITSSISAPGAEMGFLRWEAGTNSGTLKLVAYSGTSTTGVTVVDNVGAGN
jgi:hypothetical protein